MPKKWFLCPDGEQIEIKDCIEKGCRIPELFPGERCLSKPTLTHIAQERPWTGTPSTTQLLNGTMKSVLELWHDYTVNPMESMWAVHGTGGHAVLERHSDNVLVEERLKDEQDSGQTDLWDDGILWDYKFWAAYKLARAMGLHQVQVEDGVYKRDTKYAKKGDTKYKKVWQDGGEPDLYNETLQLNDYRMKWEATGFPVRRMVIQAMCRDAGTWFTEQSRGITDKVKQIDIPRLPDEEVTAYFKAKRDALLQALETKTLPEPCNAKECWDGRRCRGYCDVSHFCPQGQQPKEEPDEHIREVD